MWDRRTFILFILVLSTCVFAVKFLFFSSPPAHKVRLQPVDLQPIPYTSLAKCENIQNGGIYCPDIRQKGPTLLRRAQLVLTRVLRIFDLIAKKYGIKYWLYRGSLLGAVRHRGHNPFDGDIDICIPKADYEKFIKYGLSDLPEDIFLQTEDTDVYYKAPPHSGMLVKLRDTKSCYKTCLRSGCKHMDGLQIDMYVLDTDSDGNFLELYSHPDWFIRRFIYGPIKRKQSDIFPLIEVNFDGFSIPAPRKWRKILHLTYGDFMKIPNEKPPGHVITDALQSCEEIKNNKAIS